ncbi:MAG TPA: GAF domain-containing SpoIIE family protein phosphatase [Mycobacteriales bacterium]|jgi:serine phosphatase RsbU (regulator of sigma subunit)|nr:GAF domain-containing SpoIIE family protein phosphatase [Mycobacteriales bacterium]
MATLDQTPPQTDDRLRQIETLTDTALAYLSLDSLLVQLLDRTRDILAVDTAAVLLLDPQAGQLIATAARGIEEEVRQAVRVPVGRGFAGTIVAERRPLILNEVTATNVVNPILIEKGIRSLLGVPLIATGSVVGVLHVGTLIPRQFADADVELLQLVADRIALAVQSQLYRADQSAARVLARSLMPAQLPRVPGLELAARYVPNDQRGVGGDWYDILDLPDGRLGVVIGDVTGHGLGAAIVMGRLRSALRAYALIESDPAVVLQYLDRKMQHFEPGPMATVAYGIFSPDREQFAVSLAGHFPPVIAEPGEPTMIPELPVDPPLGVQAGIRRRTSTLRVTPGTVLCLFTDGLIERRGSDIDADLRRLRDTLTAGTAEQTCASVLAALVDGDALTDDIALLTLRRVQAGQPG